MDALNFVRELTLLTKGFGFAVTISDGPFSYGGDQFQEETVSRKQTHGRKCWTG